MPVSFAGEGSGHGELSWGQREIWSAMMRQGWLSLGGVMPLPPGYTVQALADNLSRVMSYYPSTRTRLRFDDAGRPSQVLFASGQTVIEVFDADPDDEQAPQRMAAAVESRLRTTPRDFEDEWPTRVGVIRQRGRLTHQVAVTCHLVTDGAGAEVMSRQLAAGLRAPPTGMQQLEQAAWQHSDAGARQSEISLRYWEKMLRTIPPRALPKSVDPREPRHWTGRLRSPALHAAVPLIAERTRTDSSSVLLALYAVALGEVTAVNPVVVWPLVNNRFRPGLADVVCNLVQSGICVLDVEGGSFDDVVRRTWRAALKAYKHAYYDSVKHDQMIRRLAPEQGPETGVAYFFNDRRSDADRASAVTAARPGEVGVFEWTAKKDNPFERMFLNVEDTSSVVELSVSADTYFFAPADIEALACHMETVAIAETS